MVHQTDFPDELQDDIRMIAYVVLTFCVQFLLMLNFMLASKEFRKVSIVLI